MSLSERLSVNQPGEVLRAVHENKIPTFGTLFDGKSLTASTLDSLDSLAMTATNDWHQLRNRLPNPSGYNRTNLRTYIGDGMVTQMPLTRPRLEITWEPLPDNFVLPDDPVENIQQPFLAAALTDALDANGCLTPEMLIASNFGLVATVNQKTIVKAPDWLYVPRAQPLPTGTIRRSYTPHIEGAAVAIVMEFLSDEDGNEYSARPTYPYGKQYFYEQILQVPTYAIFDPDTLLLEVRCLQEGRYVLQPANEQGQYWVPELQLFLGIWYGLRVGITTHWLRWWDADGNRLLWNSEKAEQEAARAEQEAARAEQEAARAEQEAARAEQEAARANAAEAEVARLRALLEEQTPPGAGENAVNDQGGALER